MYQAEIIEQLDLKYGNVYNVPVISEYYPAPKFSEKSETGFVQEYSTEVIQAFYDFYMKQQNSAGGDHPIIIHINHAKLGEPIQCMGLLFLTKIEKHKDWGLTIYGDFKYINIYCFNDILLGKIPYWSSETLDNKTTGSITGMALLNNAESKFCYEAFTPETIKLSQKQAIAQFPELEFVKKVNQKYWRQNSMDPKDEKKDTGVPAVLANKKNETEVAKPAITLETIHDAVMNLTKILTDHISGGENKMNEAEPEKEADKKENEADDKPETKEEEKKENCSEPEEKKINQVASINANQCSRKLVEYARKFPSVAVETLEKLEKAGLSENEITLFVKNQKETFSTVGAVPKQNQKASEDSPEVAKIKSDLEMFNKVNGTKIPFKESLVNTIKILNK